MTSAAVALDSEEITMPKRFAPVEHAAEQGFANIKPSAGAKLVSDWVKEVEGLDLPGAKGLHAELVRLEQELGHDTPDGGRIKTLLGKIGPATVKLADKCEDETMAGKVRSLGEALGKAA